MKLFSHQYHKNKKQSFNSMSQVCYDHNDFVILILYLFKLSNKSYQQWREDHIRNCWHFEQKDDKVNQNVTTLKHEFLCD